MPTLAAHQTQYLPYPGVLDKLFQSDIFVFLDNVQYVKQEYQNRNRIRTATGWQWLSIPVQRKTKPPISAVLPVDGMWKERHQKTIHAHYAKSPYLARMEELWHIAEKHKEAPLSIIAYKTTLALLKVLDAARLKKVKIFLESELSLTDEETATATKRLIALCKKLGCDRYLSGAGAQAYLDTTPWEKEGIALSWQEFHLKPYLQQYPGWEPNLSTVDLILNVKEPLKHIQV